MSYYSAASTIRAVSAAQTGSAAEVIVAVVAGVVEEIIFRGLLFRLSSKISGRWGPLLLTAALFGAAHGANPGATVASSLAIAVEAGVLLGAVYAATGSLWMTIGLHFGWNVTTWGPIFGMTVSGSGSHYSLLRGSLSGPAILTGGAVGPEASIVAVVVCLIAASYLIRRMMTRDQTEPPVWRKTEPLSYAVSASSGTH